MACQCGDPLLVQVNGANGCIRTLSRGGVPLTFVHKDLARVVHEVCVVDGWNTYTQSCAMCLPRKGFEKSDTPHKD